MKAKKLRRIAEAAGFMVEGKNIYPSDCFDNLNFDLNIFADMIIQECMDAVLDSSPEIIKKIKDRTGYDDELA